MTRRSAFVAILALLCLHALVQGAQLTPDQPRTAAARDTSDLVASLKGGSGAEAPVVAKGTDGFVRWIIAPPGSEFPTSTQAAGGAEACARAFLRERAALLHKESPLIGFEVESTSSDNNRSYLRLQQTYAGLPVYGAQVIVQVGSAGGVQYVLSHIMRDTGPLDSGSVGLAPSVQASAAELAATEFLSREYGPLQFEASPAVLMIYEPAIRGFSGPPKPVWRTETDSLGSPGTEYCVIVDARTGEVVFHYPLFCSVGIDREIYDANDSSDQYRSLERQEGGGASTITDVNLAYDYLGDTYDFYWTHHQRDSIDGAGQTMSATVRYCEPGEPLPWNNAMWSWGTERMYFGTGHATDDIVGHELTHGVTQHTTGLVYENISGAINESFSDIWGEFIDLENGTGTDTAAVKWHIGEDRTGGLGWRDMSDPPNRPDGSWPPQPDRAGQAWPPVEEPRRSNDYGWVHINSGIVNKLCYLLVDGDSFNGFSVNPMGIDKVARLFYHVQSNRLIPTDAQFQHLYFALTDAAINLEWPAGDRANLENACRAVEINTEMEPGLSKLHVQPASGIENSTTFEFVADYTGNAPLDDYCKVYISGIGGRDMTLKSGTATNGTYHHQTMLPWGSYSYFMTFVDTNYKSFTTSWHSGPVVYRSGYVAINIVIQCTRISSDLWLKYSLTGPEGPWTEIPITKEVLDPLYLPADSHPHFWAGVHGPNYEYVEWQLKCDDTRIGNVYDKFDFSLPPSCDEAGLNVFYRYSPKPFDISGTVSRADSTLVPGGVDLTLTSPEETRTHHSEDGTWAFLDVTGGVTVTITPSAEGYTFSPAHLIFEYLDNDKTGQSFKAYDSDDYVPLVSFQGVPAVVSENSSVSFSWTGSDNKSLPANLLY